MRDGPAPVCVANQNESVGLIRIIAIRQRRHRRQFRPFLASIHQQKSPSLLIQLTANQIQFISI